MHEASFYSRQENRQVQCHLCPRNCIIEDGRFGNCHARRNRNGMLSSEVYGRISACHSDPIEKKPLYHYYPGEEILSVGTTGCNLHCIFCQNHTLSQCDNRKPVIIKNIAPGELLNLARKKKHNIGVAFTYNEPIINYEYVIDTARLIKMEDMHAVLISNGYINPDPLDMLLEYIDAFNIDLKGFTKRFYQKYTGASLQPVLHSLKKIAKSGRHLELTNLVIPGANDDDDEFDNMCRWIANELGKDKVLHLSRFFPRFELNQYPTPPELLFHFYDLAKKHLDHVYLGNMATELHSNTYCPQCEQLLIERTYFNIVKKGVDGEGKCQRCGMPVFKHFHL